MTKYKLTKYEQETFQRYNQEELTAFIETMDPGLIRHMEKKLGIKPVSTDEWGGRCYEIPKNWLPYPHPPRTLKPETKAILAERMRKLAQERKKAKNRQ